MSRHKKTGKGRGVLFVIIALIAWIAWNIFDSSNQQSGSISMSELEKEIPAPKGTWPYLEDGKQASVATNLLATNIYIVFDGSGSMGEGGCSDGDAKIDVAKRAVIEFAKSIPAETNIGLMAFDNNGISERVTLSPINPEKLTATVNRIRYGSGTPLTAAMNLAYTALTDQAKKQLGYGEYHMLVVTDGQANDAAALSREVYKILKFSPILISTIGFCIDENHSLHQPGETEYSTATDFDSLLQGMRSVLAEAPSFSVSDFKE